MIRIEKHRLGRREPLLSIGVHVTSDLSGRVESWIRYLKEVDYPGLEVVVGYFEGEPWHESKGKNATAQAASTDYLALTAIDDYPSLSLLARTRIELEQRPDTVTIAMKLDGLPNYGATPNPFALGDWICMRREKYLALGGYNESLNPGCWFENEFLGRAILAGHDIVMLDERVFHSWHPIRHNMADYAKVSEENKQSVLSSGGCLAILYYPSVAELVWQDRRQQISVMPQIGSVVNITSHLPYNDDYWDCIMHDKAIKLQLEQQNG